MNWHSVRAVVEKDLSLFLRNRLFLVITFLGLAMYLVIYFVMPSTVNESVKLGVRALEVPSTLTQDSGLKIVEVGSEEALKEGVQEEEYVAGVFIPDALADKLYQGQPADIKVYFTSETAEETKDFVDILITEMAYAETGETINVMWQPEILGTDMIGDQISYREKMRPLFAVLIMVMETFALASLISEEVARRTAGALLVTPMRVRDLFAAKAIVGILLAFSQGLLFVAIVGGMNEEPFLIGTALFLGAVLVTGVGFFIASLGKDFVSVSAWGFPFFILLSLPAMMIVLPGPVSDWMRVIPSYYLTDTLYQVSVLEASWNDVWGNLIILVVCNLLILSVGLLALRRRFQCV